ncbi:MAG: hypothetical protein M3323_06170 [Actinomycetota bacterium]|nr:hypothetical protein [Actinomycetota bacterium]
MPDPYELETYESCVGDAFRLEFADHPPVDLTLAEAAPSPWQREEGGRVAFRLEFTGPTEPLLDQRTYRMQHDELGTIEIFIVPVGRDEKGATYEAIFT